MDLSFPRLSRARRWLDARCCHRGGGWLAIAIALLVALTSGHARAADGPAPAATDFRDLRVQVIGTGRPVLMIPGLNSAGETWTDTCRALQPGVQCHLVTLPGFAGRPAADTSAHWLDRMRDELLAYVDDRHLAAPVVMGHSLGGALALMMASKAPGRLDRLVIVDSLPFLAALRNPAATEADAQAMAASMREQFARATPAQFEAQVQASARGLTRTADGAARLVDWGRASDRATTAEAMSELWGLDLRPALSRIDRPVMVLGSWAAYEPMGATMETTRHIFEAQYATLHGVDLRMSERGYHFLMWDDGPWLVAQVREFAALH